MKVRNSLASTCQYCRYYQIEGRRGGTCQQLEVPVQGKWKACTLALPAFAPSWKELEEMVSWPGKEGGEILSRGDTLVSTALQSISGANAVSATPLLPNKRSGQYPYV